jgi:murein DD-endopeptidase MepM/ murein hydrolase activator NlpD
MFSKAFFVFSLVIAALFVGYGIYHRATRQSVVVESPVVELEETASPKSPVVQREFLPPTVVVKDGACLAWPFDQRPVQSLLVLGFGVKHPLTGHPHTGVDFALPQGTILNAVADGEIIEAGKDPFQANVVVMRVGKIRILYGHLSVIRVKVGDKVRRHDVIGESGGALGAEGSGSLSSGPHLHLSAFNDAGQAIDPEPLFCR